MAKKYSNAECKINRMMHRRVKEIEVLRKLLANLDKQYQQNKPNK